MGWFSRVIIETAEPGDECFYGGKRGTHHGSGPKKELSKMGGKAMKRDSKPDGFLFKDRRRP